MASPLRVALAQVNPIVGDLEGNARLVIDWIGRAREQGADIVCFPELVLTGYPPEDLVLKRAFVRDNLRQLDLVTKATKGISAVVGFVDDDGAIFNAAAFMQDGELKAVYRKVHMFDVEVGGRSYRESALEEPGEDIVLSSTADGVGLGMSICYDLRFPELYRILAVRGAHVIAVPAAFTLATTRDHWETLVRARAIENQAFVIAANQVGSHPAGQQSGGRSMIVDPWGVVLAQAPDSEAHIVAELDLDRQREIRASLPSLANRRPGAYRWPAMEPA